MIGPITDSSALFIGGLAGTLFSGLIPNRVKETLPLIFGVITLCMGSTLVNKASALPVVVMALIVGSVIGELIFAESFLAKCIRALFRLAKSKHCGNETYIVNIITLVSAFCFGSMGIFGAINEGITGSTDILLTKAVLDLFSGIVFGTLFGLSVSLIAIPQFAILSLLYVSAAFLAPYMTPGMLSDFTACGGVIFVATGAAHVRHQNLSRDQHAAVHAHHHAAFGAVGTLCRVSAAVHRDAPPRKGGPHSALPSRGGTGKTRR